MGLFELGEYVAERIVVCGHLGRIINGGLGHAGNPNLFYCVIKTRHTPYSANAAIPTDQIRPVILLFQNSEKIIANPSGASALNRSASARRPFARANIARVSPHSAQGCPVNQ